MSKSIIIRHAKTKRSWDELSYKELTKLIKQESDPSSDKAFLEQNLDVNKLKKLKVIIIYSSPRKRAVQTAGYLSKIIKAPVKIIPELNEVKFDGIPYQSYAQGKESIREFLFNKSVQSNINKRMKKLNSLVRKNAIIVTHGFVMRLIFSQLFGTDINKLKTDKRFTQYLSGFDYPTGKRVSLLKERDKKNEAK